LLLGQIGVNLIDISAIVSRPVKMMIPIGMLFRLAALRLTHRDSEENCKISGNKGVHIFVLVKIEIAG
jgi:hypothetical protein